MPQGDLGVVVPTRNRADMACRAVESVLAQQVSAPILVSDNSSDPEQRKKLRDFCAARGVAFIAPSTDLPMSRHWNFALEMGMDRLDATHYTFLTDRMVFHPHALAILLSAIRAHPQKIVSYNHDWLDDMNPRRIRLRLERTTWKIYEVSADDLLIRTAQGQPWLWPLPRMLNCAVPGAFLREVHREAGRVFASISPDFYFGYSVLARIDGFVTIDAPLLVHYGQSRSNGAALGTGRPSADWSDFWSRRSSEALTFESPFADIRTVRNSMMSEYATVARESGSLRFPAISYAGLLATIEEDIGHMAPGPIRAEAENHFAGATGRTVRAADQPCHRLRWRLASWVPVDFVPRSLRTRRLAVTGYYRSLETALHDAFRLAEPVFGPSPPGAVREIGAALLQ